jgi:hypothetical protein
VSIARRQMKNFNGVFDAISFGIATVIVRKKTGQNTNLFVSKKNVYK